ncbi:MAG: hypothetical protein F4Z07_06355, partial [Dehalococcoidia bacterium]|nr:hypothetical protein [Dehalococcoidia bacterium]
PLARGGRPRALPRPPRPRSLRPAPRARRLARLPRRRSPRPRRRAPGRASAPRPPLFPRELRRLPALVGLPTCGIRPGGPQ